MLLALIVMGGLSYTIYKRTQKGPILIAGHEVLSIINMYFYYLFTGTTKFNVHNGINIMFSTFCNG